MNASTTLERILTHETAEEYRSRGYEISTDVPLDFLPGFIVDILAHGTDETRVIRVKSRTTLAANPRIAELADILESMKGWTFELVLAGEPEHRDSPQGSRSLDRDQVERRIQEARRALDVGLIGAAFVLGWSACEAATRELLAKEGISKEEITSASYVLEQAHYLGYLSGEQYRLLVDLQKYRNAIVHGFSHDDLGAEAVMRLIETTRQISASYK